MKAKKMILAVDDTAISLAAIERTLRDKYDVVTVNSGVRALRYIETEKPDLILLDIRMANKTGIETLREMRNLENGADVPVIMLTSAQDKKTFIESTKLGIYDYVLKPFDQDDLRSRVRYVLAKAEQDLKKREEEKLKAAEEDSSDK